MFNNNLASATFGIETLDEDMLDVVTGGSCDCGCSHGCEGRDSKGCDQKGGGYRDRECNDRTSKLDKIVNPVQIRTPYGTIKCRPDVYFGEKGITGGGVSCKLEFGRK